MKKANKLQWEYKCSNQNWWRATAEMDRKEWNSNLKCHDWIWEVRIERHGGSEGWVETWGGYVKGQDDMPIWIEDVLREWMAGQAGWMMGFAKHGVEIGGER